MEALCVSPDGRTLLSGDTNGRLRFWNTDTWNYLGSAALFRTNHMSGIRAMAITPDTTAIDLAIGGSELTCGRLARLPLTPH